MQETRCSSGGLPDGLSPVTATARSPHSTLLCRSPARTLRPLCNCLGGRLVPAGLFHGWPSEQFFLRAAAALFACTGVAEQARSAPSACPARSSRLTPRSAVMRCSVAHLVPTSFTAASFFPPSKPASSSPCKHIVFTQGSALWEICFMQLCTQMQRIML